MVHSFSPKRCKPENAQSLVSCTAASRSKFVLLLNIKYSIITAGPGYDPKLHPTGWPSGNVVGPLKEG